jgi:hypothetical protein
MSLSETVYLHMCYHISEITEEGVVTTYVKELSCQLHGKRTVKNILTARVSVKTHAVYLTNTSETPLTT